MEKAVSIKHLTTVSFEPEASTLQIAADIYLPENISHTSTLVFFCLPGGGMNKRYYNLSVPGAEQFSFARQMIARGHVVVAIDPVGVGDSDRPKDGFSLLPEAMAEAHAQAVAAIRSGLLAGTLTASLPALSSVVAVGVGHSVGGLLFTLQQARYHSFDGLALLGVGAGGLPQDLTDTERPFIDNPAALRANLRSLAQARFGKPYFNLETRGRGRALFGGHANQDALVAIREQASATLLATTCMLAMMPGSCRDYFAALTVPVLIASGDDDMAGAPRDLAPYLSGCPDLTLVTLEKTGHSHFAFPSCAQLFERMHQWGRSVSSIKAE